MLRDTSASPASDARSANALAADGREAIGPDRDDALAEIGLVWSTDDGPGITRRKAGSGFAYKDPRGHKVTHKPTLERIRKLGIPPAYTDVWINPRANGHVQATGRDAKGRKQYRYHPDFRAAQESTKYERMLAFGRELPRIRARVAEHMALPGLPREKVLATLVHLLETTLIRVGNEDYAKENRSYGLTTLRDRHVKAESGRLRFDFKGKSGKTWRLSVENRRVARIVKQCQDLPGQHLFQYLDDDGERRAVTSADVNDYLREICREPVTAKDFRTWAGTVLAAVTLNETDRAETVTLAKRNVKAAIERVSERLGNTPTVCRKCYVHPEVLSSYLDGALALRVRRQGEEEAPTAGLSSAERAVLRFLEARVASADGAKDAA